MGEKRCNGTVTSPDDIVIRKRGYFYRPDCKGYTSCVWSAGAYEPGYANEYCNGLTHESDFKPSFHRAGDLFTEHDREHYTLRDHAEKMAKAINNYDKALDNFHKYAPSFELTEAKDDALDTLARTADAYRKDFPKGDGQ